MGEPTTRALLEHRGRDGANRSEVHGRDNGGAEERGGGLGGVVFRPDAQRIPTPARLRGMGAAYSGRGRPGGSGAEHGLWNGQGWPRRGAAWTHASRLGESRLAPHSSRASVP